MGAAHTGIFTSLTRSDQPVTLPVWFIAADRVVYFSTPASAKKVARVRNNGAASFLVESGQQWSQLTAVHLSCRAVVIDDPALVAWVDQEKEVKYRSFRTAHQEMTAGTRGYYESSRVAIRLDPIGKILSWDNARIDTSSSMPEPGT
ncbi:MAG TPA: pyridoxamine 5'-phosphate oxidase family protein [Acidimicrobiales bacterium]|nr:pyridoxamine 5'-phosphate oxidase family protein [Acidimicrobiales bacterium]